MGEFKKSSGIDPKTGYKYIDNPNITDANGNIIVNTAIFVFNNKTDAMNNIETGSQLESIGDSQWFTPNTTKLKGWSDNADVLVLSDPNTLVTNDYQFKLHRIYTYTNNGAKTTSTTDFVKSGDTDNGTDLIFEGTQTDPLTLSFTFIDPTPINGKYTNKIDINYGGKLYLATLPITDYTNPNLVFWNDSDKNLKFKQKSNMSDTDYYNWYICPKLSSSGVTISNPVQKQSSISLAYFSDGKVSVSNTSNCGWFGCRVVQSSGSNNLHVAHGETEFSLFDMTSI